MTLQLDEDLVQRARQLAVCLGMKALYESQANSTLSEDEASALAYEELHAHRRTRPA